MPSPGCAPAERQRRAGDLPCTAQVLNSDSAFSPRGQQQQSARPKFRRPLLLCDASEAEKKICKCRLPPAWPTSPPAGRWYKGTLNQRTETSWRDHGGNNGAEKARRPAMASGDQHAKNTDSEGFQPCTLSLAEFARVALRNPEKLSPPRGNLASA